MLIRTSNFRSSGEIKLEQLWIARNANKSEMVLVEMLNYLKNKILPNFLQMRWTYLSLETTYLKYPVVEIDHNKTRYVEREGRRRNDEDGIVESAGAWESTLVVQSCHDGYSNCNWDQPYECNCEHDSIVVFVLRVANWLRHRNVPKNHYNSNIKTQIKYNYILITFAIKS